MLARFLLCVVLSAIAQPLVACNVPVFRYALERWPAEPFEVLVFFHGTLEPAQRTLVDSLEKSSQAQFANVEVTLADLDTRLAPEWQRVWQKQTNAALPWTVILPPHGDEEPVPLWSGQLDSNIVARVIASPLRREIAKRLLRGDSAVWLLLETGDKRVDDPVADLLSRELATEEKQIRLPEPDPEDPRMHAPLPVRVAFSTVRVSQHDPSEAWLIKMLLHGEQEKAAPIVFPIFARGRALAALSAAQLTPKIIQDAARFICGACSCEVKELNPGKDLLLAANWSSIFNPGTEPSRSLPTPVIQTQSAAPPEPIVWRGHFTVSRRTILGVAILAAGVLVVLTGSRAFRGRQK